MGIQLCGVDTIFPKWDMRLCYKMMQGFIHGGFINYGIFKALQNVFVFFANVKRSSLDMGRIGTVLYMFDLRGIQYTFI
jgi:hypothetical protein